MSDKKVPAENFEKGASPKIPSTSSSDPSTGANASPGIPDTGSNPPPKK